MKTAVFEIPYSIVLQEQETPRIGKQDILVKIGYCGICGTDVHIYKGQVPFVQYPIIPGHEFSGTIVEISSMVSSLSIGDRVAINPNLSCKDLGLLESAFCYYCKKNRPHFCKNWEALGVTRSGGFAEYVKCPATSAIRIPSTQVSLKEAAFMEPVACALHGIKKLNLLANDTVLIIGAGSIGLIMVSLLKELYNPKIIVSEPIKVRRELASTLGASEVINPLETSLEQKILEMTENEGVDISIEAVGSATTAKVALNTLNKGGRSLIFGVASDATLKLSLFDLYSKEWSIFGSFTNPHENQQAMSLLAKRVINTKILISHELELTKLEKGIKLMSEGDANVKKILIKLAE